jgi:hypothetical protein
VTARYQSLHPPRASHVSVCPSMPGEPTTRASRPGCMASDPVPVRPAPAGGAGTGQDQRKGLPAAPYQRLPCQRRRSPASPYQRTIRGYTISGGTHRRRRRGRRRRAACQTRRTMPAARAAGPPVPPGRRPPARPPTPASAAHRCASDTLTATLSPAATLWSNRVPACLPARTQLPEQVWKVSCSPARTVLKRRARQAARCSQHAPEHAHGPCSPDRPCRATRACM